MAAVVPVADTYNRNDVLSIEESIVGHVEYTLARSRYKFDDLEAYQATSYSLRDRLILLWNDTQQFFKCAFSCLRPMIQPSCFLLMNTATRKPATAFQTVRQWPSPDINMEGANRHAACMTLSEMRE